MRYARKMKRHVPTWTLTFKPLDESTCHMDVRLTGPAPAVGESITLTASITGSYDTLRAKVTITSREFVAGKRGVSRLHAEGDMTEGWS